MPENLNENDAFYICKSKFKGNFIKIVRMLSGAFLAAMPEFGSSI